MSGGHTPGPWKVGLSFVNKSGEGFVAVHVHLPGNHFYPMRSVMGINFSEVALAGKMPCEMPDLILACAAPDLLAALQEARAALHFHYVEWDGEPEDAVPLQLARSKCDAAIAKATGVAS